MTETRASVAALTTSAEMLSFTGFDAELRAFQANAFAYALGVFDVNGEPRFLNTGMRRVLGGDGPDRELTAYFVNPSFADLSSRPAQVEPVFEGLLNLGDGHRINRSLRAVVHRRDDQVLVQGELDALELDRLNREMSSANQQVNNLQRELLKKNRLLEQTLEELKQTQGMLIHAEKMQATGQLVAGVAHEINNPLGFVSGNIHSLQESTTDLVNGFQALERIIAVSADAGAVNRARTVRREHDVDFIVEDLPGLITATLDGLKRVQDIVQNLRTFSRLHEAERKSADLLEGVKSTLALARSQLDKAGIQVRLEFDPLPFIECYPAELNQVFMNLIVNGMQAMEPGGRLTISGCKRGDEQVLLEFSDTGYGIPEDVLARVFDPFFTTKPVGSGTGLGLSVAHSIISERHGGRLEARSTRGEGSVFSIFLPLSLPKDAE